jgi:O-antigen ligase
MTAGQLATPMPGEATVASRAVVAAAALWGVAVWFPVGFTYAAMLLTLAAVIAAPDRRARWQRARDSRLLLLPALLFVWLAVVFVIAPRGESAPAMLGHFLRFLLTLAAGLMLWPREARVALAAFGLTAGALLAALLAEVVVGGVPRWPGLLDVLDYLGNKSIRAGLLMALLAAAAAAWLVWHPPGGRRATLAALAALAALAGGGLAVVGYLPSRSAMLLLPLLLLAVGLHRWRGWRPLLALFSLLAVAALLVFAVSAHVRDRLVGGFEGLQADRAQGSLDSSWGQRDRLYRFSAERIAASPLRGGGLGSWPEAWDRAMQGTAAVGLNNPHNDYLLLGAEAGLPAPALLLACLAMFLRHGWRRQRVEGGIAFACAAALLLAAAGNAAVRDAVFGLSLVWLMAASAAASGLERQGRPPTGE